MPVVIPQLSFANTFGHWIQITNLLSNAMSSIVVTTNGIATTGNAIVNGSITSNTITVGRIQGIGSAINVATSNVTFDTTTNTIFNGTTQFNGNATFQAASRMIVAGANATHRVIAFNSNGVGSFITLRLQELTDVSMSGAANGHTIFYNGNTFFLAPPVNNFDTLTANTATINSLSVGTISSPLTVVGAANSSISNLLYVNPAASRVGVGVPTPLAALHINGGIIASGDVQARNVSDIRFKKNIRPIQDALVIVDSVGGYRFQWNEDVESVDYTTHYDGEDDLGVIAQDVKSVLPEAVGVRDDGSLSVDYIKLIPVLLAAVKQLKQRVEELEAKHGDQT
jgi:hypothetical protein